MGQFGSVNPGDDVRRLIKNAAWINHVTNAADRVAPAIPSTRSGGIPGHARLVLDVVNNSGAAIDAPYPILRLTTPAISLSDNANIVFNDPQFMGDTPDASTAGSFVVVQGPIGAGVARPAVLVGLTWCKVNVTNAAHAYATAINGDNTKVQSATAGVPIVWKESSTGEKWALLLLGALSPAAGLQWGQSTTAITAATAWATPGTGTVQFKDAAGSNDGSPVTVKNPYRDAFDDKSIVCCDRRYDPPRIVSVGCTPGT